MGSCLSSSPGKGGVRTRQGNTILNSAVYTRVGGVVVDDSVVLEGAWLKPSSQ